MEALIFAFIALRNLYGHDEPVVAETQPFKPLDLQSLRYVYRSKESSTNQSADRNDSHLTHAVF
jgi:hypothetical protein